MPQVKAIPPTKRKTGFALMPPERRREVAIAGGKMSQGLARGHRFDSATGRAAGLVGGQVTAAKLRALELAAARELAR